jgi:hypothetical protein
VSKDMAYPSGRTRRIPAWGTARHNALLGVTALAVGLAVALLPPEAAVALVVGAVLLILIAIEPMAGLVITLSVAPLKTLIETEAEINLPADVGQIALAVTVGVWFARRVADRRGAAYLYGLRPSRYTCRALLPHEGGGGTGEVERASLRLPSPARGEGRGVRGFSPVFLPLLLYIFVSALSIIDAPATGAGLRELLKWVEVALVAALTVDLVGGDRNRLRWAVWAMLAAGAAHALIGLYEFFGGSGAAHLAILGGSYYRAFGSFGQPNPFAGFLGLCLTLALGAAWGALTEWFSRFPRLEPWANLRVLPLTPGPSPTRGEGSRSRFPVPPPFYGGGG